MYFGSLLKWENPFSAIISNDNLIPTIVDALAKRHLQPFG